MHGKYKFYFSEISGIFFPPNIFDPQLVQSADVVLTDMDTFTFLQSWKPEVRDQVGLVPSESCEEKTGSRNFSLACGWLSPPLDLTLSSVQTPDPEIAGDMGQNPVAENGASHWQSLAQQEETRGLGAHLTPTLSSGPLAMTVVNPNGNTG